MVMDKDKTIKQLIWDCNQIAVFEHYIGKFKLKRPMRSPFREDKNPSFNVFRTTCGMIKYKDLGNGEFGDVVDLIARMERVDTSKAIEILRDKFTSGSIWTIADKKEYSREVNTTTNHSQIDIIEREFTPKDLTYWGNHLLTPEDLNDGQIVSLQSARINGNKIYQKSHELAFAYKYPSLGPDKFKIYFPGRKSYKWFSNIPLTTVEGLEDLGKGPIIVTKSRKCRLVLKKLGLNTCSVQNESQSAFPEEFINLLIERQDEGVYIQMDADNAGKSAAGNLKESYGFETLFVPERIYRIGGIKDFSEWVFEDGPEPAIAYLKKKGLL